MFSFVRNHQTSAKVSVQYCISISDEWEFLFFPSLLTFSVITVPDSGYSNRSIVGSLCCFNFHFSDDLWCKISFHMLICHLYIFSSEVSVKIFGLSFIRLLVLLSFLFFNVYLFLREHQWGRGRERRGQKIQSKIRIDNSEPNTSL